MVEQCVTDLQVTELNFINWDSFLKECLSLSLSNLNISEIGLVKSVLKLEIGGFWLSMTQTSYFEEHKKNRGK